MTPFLKQLQVSAATFEEILSDEFQVLPGQKEFSDKSALRLSAWCRATASGDWSLFFKRLKRDNLTAEEVLSRFNTVRPLFKNTPEWALDSEWILEALENAATLKMEDQHLKVDAIGPFQDLFLGQIEMASKKVIEKLSFDPREYFSKSGWVSYQSILLKQITDLSAPVLFNIFIKHLKSENAANPTKIIDASSDTIYKNFIEQMQNKGMRELFIEKPVLLRLIANITRQWITTSIKLLNRIQADFSEITQNLISNNGPFAITAVIGGLSDAHNLGNSVLILVINDENKIIYKPKDLELDYQWYQLCEKLNRLNPPVTLRAVKTIARHGYGWTEFIPHSACTSIDELALFFKRAGSWLALFHLYASADMHFENLIASGSHPVPIDLEMILQATSPESELSSPEMLALNEVNQKISNSVLSVGILPAYTRLPNNEIINMGGLNGDIRLISVGTWTDMNTDGMRWSKEKKELDEFPNIPYQNGSYAKLGDYLPDFLAGFKSYSEFLYGQKEESGTGFFLDDFKNLPVRKLIRPTRFYAMLMGRLKDYRTMNDGITWSVQADFVARLSNWDKSDDVIWPLQKSERDALLCLNIPHFTTPSDGQNINDLNGELMSSPAISGLDRARSRFENLTHDEIAWQTKVIELSTFSVSSSNLSLAEKKYEFDRILPSSKKSDNPDLLLGACADDMAKLILKSSFQKQDSIAWIGLDWLGDSEVTQLVPLHQDLYNGTAGIAIFLAAHYQVCGSEVSQETAYKVIACIRHLLQQSTAARWARGMGIGGASGLGSIVYSLTVLSELLNDQEILKDAETAALLFTADLIQADDSLDIIGGSAGAILGLLKLYNTNGSQMALDKAILCGDHLLNTPRIGDAGARSWFNNKITNDAVPLTGISHGASGFAFALLALFAKTGRSDFLEAGKECLNYEKANFSFEHKNWGDLRSKKKFICQWCHGAIGIGLARLGISRVWDGYHEELHEDIQNALETARTQWPNKTDSLCCGTLGSIELFKEAGSTLIDSNLDALSSERFMAILAASKENNGFCAITNDLQFNLGLFRGAAGIGYTALRQFNSHLPNILLWQ